MQIWSGVAAWIHGTALQFKSRDTRYDKYETLGAPQSRSQDERHEFVGRYEAMCDMNVTQVGILKHLKNGSMWAHEKITFVCLSSVMHSLIRCARRKHCITPWGVQYPLRRL